MDIISYSKTAKLEDKFNKQVYRYFTNVEIGSIAGTTGKPTAGTTRIRTFDFIDINVFDRCDVTLIPSYTMYVFLYDANRDFLERIPGSWTGNTITQSDVLNANSGTAYIKVLFNKSESQMSDTDVANLKTAIIINVVDELKQSEIPMAVKDELVKSYSMIAIGSIDAYGQETAGSSRIRTIGYIDLNMFISCDLLKLKDYDMFVFLYDINRSFIQRIPSSWSNTVITREQIERSYGTTQYIKFLFRRHNDQTLSDSDVNKLSNSIKVNGVLGQEQYSEETLTERFDNKFYVVAYSSIKNDPAPINSKEHFVECAEMDFDGIKGDIAVTSDGYLIMCHDPGYTFDANSKITTYDSDNKTLIRNLTYAEVKALTFAQQYDGQDVHPADIDDFLYVAKKYGKMPYITIRDQYMSVIAPALLDKLSFYSLASVCIINSFTLSSLQAVRKLNKRVMLSQVTSYQVDPTESMVDDIAALGNACLCIFDQGVHIETNKAICAYAKAKGVRVWGAQATSKTDLENYVKAGYSGVHATVTF